MSPAVLASILAGVCYLTAYLDYNRGVFSGRIKPNAATWAIWTAIALVSAGSYLSSSGDVWKSMLPLVNIVPCTGTFVLALCTGKFEKLSRLDWAACVLAILAGAVWAACGSAATANLIVQAAIIIGFIPIWKTVWRTPSHEHARPWWLWAFSYSISVAVVVWRWTGHWIDLVSPLNCVLLHSSVAFLCLRHEQTPPAAHAAEKSPANEPAIPA